MKIFKQLINRPWKIFTLIIITILTFLALYFSVTFLPIINDAKTYVSGIQNTKDAVSINESSKELAKDLDTLFLKLNKPVIKQLIAIANLDFSIIAPELKSLIISGPQLAGIGKPQKYLLAFQNSAEARGTGGILGAYAIVIFDKGKLKVERTGTNIALKSLNEIPISVSEEYAQLYRSDPAIWQNSNLSPHFPQGARIWMALWERQYNEKLDGVMAVDPTAISYLLKATGPIFLQSKEKIDSKNVVYKVLSDAYERFETDNLARKDYLVDIINATFAKLADGDYSKIEMARAFKNAIQDNRLLVYTSNSDSQKVLAKSTLAGDLLTNASNQYRVVIQNIDASKLDYYLDREITVESLECAEVRRTQVSVKVTNVLKTGVGLPAYVLTRADKTKPLAIVTGQHRFLVFIYGPKGSSLLHAKRTSSFESAGGIATELGRPLLVSDVDLSPLSSEKITATFEGGRGPISFHDQPLVRKSTITIKDRCQR